MCVRTLRMLCTSIALNMFEWLRVMAFDKDRSETFSFVERKGITFFFYSNCITRCFFAILFAARRQVTMRSCLKGGVFPGRMQQHSNIKGNGTRGLGFELNLLLWVAELVKHLACSAGGVSTRCLIQSSRL